MKINRYSYLMMFGHICTDINQGALPAILPFLISQGGFSYTAAAGLVFASNLMSSIIQPLFGYLGDRASRPWVMALGVILAGGGLSLVGLLPSYWMIFLASMVSGIGVALFHPEGGKLAHLVSGERKGTGMSIFAVGGNVGFAIGPIIASFAMLTWGLKGTAILIIPAVAMAAVILSSSKTLRSFLDRDKEGTDTTANGGESEKRDDWNGFSRVTLVVFCRSIINYGLITFIPLYWIGVLMQTEASGNMTLTIFSLSAAVATLIGGRMADRFGFQKIIMIGSVTLFPFILLFIQMDNTLWAVLFIVLAAFAMNGSHSTLVALGQSLLPNRVGFASGIIMGLTVSIGGMAAPGIGKIGDQFGLTAAMYTIAAIAFLGLVLTFFIPKKK